MTGEAFIRQLVNDGLLRPEVARQAIERLPVSTCRADTVLLEMEALDETTLLDALGRYHSTRAVGLLDLVGIQPAVFRMLSPRVAARYEVVPFKLDGKVLSVASVSPGDLLIEDEVALLTSCRVASFVSTEARLYEALQQYYDVQLTATLQSVVNRLGGGGTVRPRTASVRRRPPPPPRAASPAGSSPTSAGPPTASPPGPVVPRRRVGDSELELSAEELELFPSLLSARGEVAGQPAPGDALETEPEAGGEPVPAASAPPTAPAETIEDRLAVAAATLQSAEMREDIADALLEFAAHYFRRRLLLFVRSDHIVGWRGEGEGVETEAVRAIHIPVKEPSVFLGLTQGMSFWLGALPAMPRNVDVVLGLGGDEPSACVIIPIALRSKVIAFLYGDNIQDGVGGAPLGELRRLAAKAAVAFEVYILKNKIRTM